MSLPNPYDKPTLTVPEAAEMLRVSKSAAYAAINDGRWPTTVINVGGRIRIPTAELLKVMVIDGQGPDPTADWPDIEEP
jgi:excisionase family DNA binding protein